MKAIIEKLISREDLSEEEAGSAVEAIVAGKLLCTSVTGSHQVELHTRCTPMPGRVVPDPAPGKGRDEGRAHRDR